MKRIGHFIIIAAAAAIAVLLFGLSVGCPFYALTGLKCPACGNTRAACALMRGDIVTSFKMNPMFLPELAVLALAVGGYGYLLFRGRCSSRVLNMSLICCAAVFVLWGIVRNIINI